MTLCCVVHVEKRFTANEAFGTGTGLSIAIVSGGKIN